MGWAGNYVGSKSIHILTINVHVVYMAQDVIILMRANPLQEPLEEVGHENKTFWGPEMPTSKAGAIWVQKC